MLRQNFDDGEHYLDLATRAVQGSLQSMVVVALCDGLLSAVAFALLGVPHAALWGAIIGLLALVPFLDYVAVIVFACQLAIKGAAVLALLSLGIGVTILLAVDKILRPIIARRKASLRLSPSDALCSLRVHVADDRPCCVGDGKRALSRLIEAGCAHGTQLPFESARAMLAD